MNKINFDDITVPTVALLIKENYLNKANLLEHYVHPLKEINIPMGTVCGYPLSYTKPSMSAKAIQLYLSALLPELTNDGIETLYVCDAAYFRILTNAKKAAENYLGYVVPCAVKGYEHFNIIYGINYGGFFYNPALKVLAQQSLFTLRSFLTGNYLPPGSSLFDRIVLVKNLADIKDTLNNLLKLPAVTADIEALSLKFYKAGISTIAFGENTEVAHGFAVDTHLGLGAPVRALLKEFFTNYTGTIIWHNAAYDLKVIVYELWMKHPLDFKGMLEGIEIMTRNFHDTKFIAYLALNSCARVEYSLKVLAQEFAGNYAEQDIKNILLIEPLQLLKYNCVDAMATWYVFDKYYQKMIDDNQNELYEGLFKKSVALLLQIELTGMPLSMDKVQFAKTELTKIKDEQLLVLNNSKIIQDFNFTVQQNACDAKNAKLKVKRVTLADFEDLKFNPGSNPQLQTLLYEVLQLPVIDKTAKKLPATGNKTLSKLKNHTTNPDVLEILTALIELTKVAKILSAFIPAFEDAWLKPDGTYYLHGNFNLGSVVSGRLSSSDPNLQNLPAGSKYGKLIKDCFMPPDGWLMAGADFSSLEDRISALTTKDPNKLKVYIDGYCGHSLRAYNYWPNQFPDIVNTVESINSIQDKYPELRNKSKAPTFALTYQGMYITLMNNCGFTETEAKQIEANYHAMYHVSDQWVQDKLVQASKDGYVTVAFGLRVRTPLLHQVVYGSRSVPYEAAAEGRTAGNALGQSYCLLNNRAAIEFRERLLASPYRLRVRMISLIHDAIYVLIENDIDVVHWVNENLPACMEWQDLPEIQHPIVKLGGNLDLFYPSWKTAYTLPNHATKEEIVAITLKPKN